MKQVLILFFIVSLLASCGFNAPVEEDPNYRLQIDTHKYITEKYLQADRDIFTLEVGDTPVTLPSGVKLTVKMPLSEPVYPQMFRDYRYEARLKFYGDLFSVLGGNFSRDFFGWLRDREEYNMWGKAFDARMGISFQSSGDLNFVGGIGDYGQWDFHGQGTASPEPAAEANE